MISLGQTEAQANEPKTYLLVARNDRVADTKPSYIYAGRHKRVVVVASRRECQVLGNRMIEAAEDRKDAAGATRFACIKGRWPLGKRYEAANLFGLPGD